MREIAGRWGISRSALDRHKTHVLAVIAKIEERREVKIGERILDGIQQLHEKDLELMSKMEENGDYRGAVLASREARECLVSRAELESKSSASSSVAVTVEYIGGEGCE